MSIGTIAGLFIAYVVATYVGLGLLLWYTRGGHSPLDIFGIFWLKNWWDK